ncbi:MAG: hypothetical protein HQM02_05600 [Magnetococcales bacterium]|nr:hypothetical protein [Magnetococcales bacterium]
MDALNLKLNRLQNTPMVYDEFLARLELDGLSQADPMDDTQTGRLQGVLDFFYDKMWLEQPSVL